MINILIRRVKRQSGIVGSCVDCIGEHLKKKKRNKGEERKEKLSFVVREKERSRAYVTKTGCVSPLFSWSPKIQLFFSLYYVLFFFVFYSYPFLPYKGVKNITNLVLKFFLNIY